MGFLYQLIIQKDGTISTGEMFPFLLLVFPCILAGREFPVIAIRTGDILNFQIDNLVYDDRDDAARMCWIRRGMDGICFSFSVQLPLWILKFGFIP